MNMSPVSRLKKTWGKVNTDKFEILEVRNDWIQDSIFFPLFLNQSGRNIFLI